MLFDRTFLIKEWIRYSLVINYFLVGSFIVKFPIFGFHYWLPVAHVEASTIGSIILAGVLLKLGSVGLLYIVRYIKFIVKFHWLSLGVIIVILIILSLRDLKIIIAYSSVAHMRIVFYVIILGSFVGKKGSTLYNILSWFYFSFNILGCRNFSLMKNAIFNSCEVYFFFLFIFISVIFFINSKHRISTFYRFYKRDFNIEIFDY